MVPATHDLIRRIVFDPGFWAGYRDSAGGSPASAVQLRLLSAGERSLEIEALLNPTLIRVRLRHGADVLPQLGYDDDASAYLPWFLRWAELDRIAQLAALRDPGLRHPGPLVALLSRFTPMTSDAELAQARPVLAAALRSLGPGPEHEEQVEYHLRHWHRCAEQGGYRWAEDGAGWVLHGECTMRERANPEFPHRDLALFLADVEAEIARLRS
ncbi:hypothetical protein AB0F81_17605 [Actinoplanes sp. NPDC024001]|uniref:hypothetical protein n=1 Tax=Actinoplanes sp. NPDC024001 TaxID=3154598 RepID=UPI0033E63E9F